jgi:hypothetical protein
MKIKKQIKKFRTLEKRIREYVTELSPSSATLTEEAVLLQEERESLMKRRQKTLGKIFNYALAH